MSNFISGSYVLTDLGTADDRLAAEITAHLRTAPEVAAAGIKEILCYVGEHEGRDVLKIDCRTFVTDHPIVGLMPLDAARARSTDENIAKILSSVVLRAKQHTSGEAAASRAEDVMRLMIGDTRMKMLDISTVNFLPPNAIQFTTRSGRVATVGAGMGDLTSRSPEENAALFWPILERRLAGTQTRFT